VTFSLIEGPSRGIGDPAVVVSALAGLGAVVWFVVTEARSRTAMLPLDLFSSRRFTGANLVTFAVYAALGGVFFFLVVFLQIVLGYSPLAAGAATLPITLLMLGLSSRAGALAQRIGPRLPMTIGPLVVAAGIGGMARLSAGDHYVARVLPAVVVFGLGLSLTVAPLTAAVLAAADVRHAGIASGVNNAVARVASLLAVAVLPIVAGLGGGDYRNPVALSAGFHKAAWVAAALAATGGVVAWLTIGGEDKEAPSPRMANDTHCALDAPPLRPAHSQVGLASD
jgi:Na+/melibiose symporter-like transporter